MPSLPACGLQCGLVYRPRSNIYKVPGNGGRGSHLGADEMRASTASLAAFEVTVAGRGAAFAGRKNVRIHAQAHGAAGLAPVKTCRDEDAVEAFRFGLRFHGL